MNEAGFPRSVILYGTGLMGCSLALALRRQFPDIRIYGVDEHEVLDRARRLGAVEVDPEPPEPFEELPRRRIGFEWPFRTSKV